MKMQKSQNSQHNIDRELQSQCGKTDTTNSADFMTYYKDTVINTVQYQVEKKDKSMVQNRELRNKNTVNCSLTKKQRQNNRTEVIF